MQFDTATVSRLVLALLVVGVVGVGAVGFWPAGTTDDARQQISVNASERLAQLDGLSGAVEATIRPGNETNRTVQRV
jgi:outer membrane lipoprotein-sorting protein